LHSDDEIEQTLIDIWRALLPVTSFGLEDSFFELGGHSLAATRLVFQVKERLGVSIPWVTVFEHPTLKSLVSQIARLRQQDSAKPEISALPDTADGGPPPLSSAQRRLWYLDQYNPGQATYNTVFSIDIRGDLDVAALEHALAEVLARHDALRTTFDA